MDRNGFRALIGRLADAWARQDATAAAACFRGDAVYMEPPDAQLFVGRDQLTAYFSPLDPGTYLDVHMAWFDEESATGAVEFSFGVRETGRADHGVAVISVVDDLISEWREYHVSGPESFSDFTSVADKTWQWHIGNYP